MMVADYLDYAATLKGISTKERFDAVRTAILSTDLAERALDPISTLSRGLRQRVGVAQAVLGRPRLLILDEPTNGLDPDQTEHMRQLIKNLARQATVILSTHIMQEVDALCDRVLILRNGQLALDQRMRDLQHSRTLQLRTNAAVESLASYLRRMPQVASVKQCDREDGLIQFSLQLHPNADMDTAANNIAKCVIKAGANLYQLQPVTRDLSKVFREVNAGGD
jgi:ABC-2 type transport system ATP-binding protein